MSGSPISSSPNTLVGLSRDKLASSVAFGFQNGDWGRFRVNGNNTESVKDSFTCLFAKAGGVIATGSVCLRNVRASNDDRQNR